jgi:hypothetical protein
MKHSLLFELKISVQVQDQIPTCTLIFSNKTRVLALLSVWQYEYFTNTRAVIAHIALVPSALVQLWAIITLTVGHICLNAGHCFLTVPCNLLRRHECCMLHIALVEMQYYLQFTWICTSQSSIYFNSIISGLCTSALRFQLVKLSTLCHRALFHITALWQRVDCISLLVW